MASWNLDEYETVSDRLIKFWESNPDGRIETELLESAGGSFIFVSRLYRTEADEKAWTSGYARETVTSSGTNQTSALENCETSAIGRALANAGFAPKGKRPSREEMEAVERQSSSTPPPRNEYEAKVNLIRGAIEHSREVTTLGEGVSIVNDQFLTSPNDEIPLCDHGEMALKSGTTKANKPYFGYVCTNKGNQCPAAWYEVDRSTGQWRPRA